MQLLHLKTWLQKIILNKAYETLYWQVPKSFMENAKMESVLININVSKNGKIYIFVKFKDHHH
jgi:hypothetical protein